MFESKLCIFNYMNLNLNNLYKFQSKFDQFFQLRFSRNFPNQNITNLIIQNIVEQLFSIRRVLIYFKTMIYVIRTRLKVLNANTCLIIRLDNILKKILHIFY